MLVGFDGKILAVAIRVHAVDRPQPGHVETDAEFWWDEFVQLGREMLGTVEADVVAVGVSGMGPCVLVPDGAGVPLHPAILHGIDPRATAQIERLITEPDGAGVIRARCAPALSMQAVGPSLRWLAENEPDVFARAVGTVGAFPGPHSLTGGWPRLVRSPDGCASCSDPLTTRN